MSNKIDIDKKYIKDIKLEDLREKNLVKASKKLLKILTEKYKINKKNSSKILESIIESTLSTMRERYQFKEPFCTQTEAGIKSKTALIVNPEFSGWVMLSLSIPFYQSLGDTIGYKNGQWEFNYGEIDYSPERVNDRIYQFISLGGINDLNIVNWVASDDTILYIATMKVLSQNNENIQDFGKNLRNEYLKTKPLIEEKIRGAGMQTKLSLERQEEIEWDKLPYNSKAIGNGSAMRSGCIGIFYPGKHNRKRLIALSVECSRITHNSATAILGSVVSALFTAYALEKVPVNHWPHKLIRLLKSDKIDSYIEKSRPNDYSVYKRDKIIYVGQWEKYLNIRFLGLNLRKDLKIMSNPVARFKYLSENFSKGCDQPGACADDCLIMAYDALLESDGTLEKLIVYSILHPGDSDTVGSVAFSWFGAYYNSPKNENIVGHRFEELEFHDELYDLFRLNISRMVEVYYYDIYMDVATKHMKRVFNK
ncbi:MAG: ADP-ribosylglycohydrolase [Satyrvirus sp.]|uniref:ADP-ribosylglycohydrolase n=1 Tax=Satyrvirus sp. TaxID=2487771 RepID=A0A3G5ADS6_9VIRU|nr:MAG: ADP-ribosylglycohydrolase [Satyrvirus sp.]